MTDFGKVRLLAGWGAGIAAFYVALQLIWPTPFGIVVWGLVISSLTALLAFGLALIYRSNRVINFAQADLGAVPASLCVSLVVLAAAGRTGSRCRSRSSSPSRSGSAVEFVVIRRFAKAPRLILMVVTIGLAQLLAGVGEAIPGFFDADVPAADPAAAVRLQLRHPAVHLPRQRARSR